MVAPLAAMALGQGLGSVAGGIAGMIAGGGGDEYRRKQIQAWKALQESDFNLSKLAPPQLEVVAQMFPEIVEAWTPERAEQIAGSPEMRSAQVQSLLGLQEVAREGVPLVDRLAAREAGEAVSGAARRSREAVLANLAARGQLGGGDELAARMIGQQQAANLAGELGSSAARDAALRRLTAMGQAGTLAGGIRGQDVSEQATNAQLATRFNELLANSINQARFANQQAAQGAQAYNVGTKQRIAEANPMLRYQTALENIERENQLKAAQFGQQLAKTQGLSGAYGGMATAQDAEAAARAQAFQGIGKGLGGVVGGSGLFGGGQSAQPYYGFGF